MIDSEACEEACREDIALCKLRVSVVELLEKTLTTEAQRSH